MIAEVAVPELEAARQQGAIVVDVREPDEYRSGHVPGAVSIPLGVVAVRAQELPKDAPVYLICQGGGRSMQAAGLLATAGYDVRSVAGGTNAWLGAGKPLATGPEAG